MTWQSEIRTELKLLIRKAKTAEVECNAKLYMLQHNSGVDGLREEYEYARKKADKLWRDVDAKESILS